ncbi:MAG TPA: S8 family serine peptidase, partial [Pyrinomonadaceae bacterium]|nr:S8 family serine peptidase [Pyrinomonadaceae bacterium]
SRDCDRGGSCGVPGLIAVGATTQSDSLATFSTRGEWVEIVAPGDGIVSSVPGGRYANWRGTSMSAPIVSGIAALVRARYPTMKASAVYDQIKHSAVPINGAGERRRVDALRAVTMNP